MTLLQSAEEEKALWKTCFAAASEQRCEFEQSFPKVERQDQHPGPAIWAEPHHGHQVAISHHDHRCAHGPDKAQKHSAFTCRGGSNCEVQKKNNFVFG